MKTVPNSLGLGRIDEFRANQIFRPMRLVCQHTLALKRLSSQFAYRAIRKTPFLPSPQRYNISICHEEKFVWFRVAKVGTRTILHELRDNNISAEHPMFVHYPINLYRDYFKFAFVRNPWDRLVSAWLNKVVDCNYFGFNESDLEKMGSFGNFVDYVSTLDIENCDLHLRLQCRLIDINHIDYLGRYESFSLDLTKVFEVLGIDQKDFVRRNASQKRKSYQEYYNERLIEKVSQIYRKDIQVFGYEYSLPK